jgi:rhodanese-related sulfurtransferase
MKRSGILSVILLIILGILIGFLYYNMSSPLAIYPDEAKALLNQGKFDAVVDVRSKMEWDGGHYPLAIHIPIDDIDDDLEERIPDKKSKILFYCNTSTRARVAAEKAQSMGYENIRYLIGTHLNLL